ncbi:MAG TPA: response regulator [Planctomycetota bacterium]|nr:response regulator [Planctomycetota bacterium]
MESKDFVLVCDDNRPIANSLVFMLQSAGYRAQAVNSALDCVAVARRDTPALIIMDIMMPGMDGATASGLMQDVPEIEGVPVILLSAMPEDQVKVRAEDAGAAGYLLKPYRKDVLLGVVRNTILPRAALKQTA